MRLKRQLWRGSAALSLLFLAACSSAGIPGGITGSTTVAVVTVGSNLGSGPGFLTPTPPSGGEAVQITPPAGGLVPTDTPKATAVPTASATPTPSTGPQATGSPTKATSVVSPTATPYETPTAQATDTPVAVASPANTTTIQVQMPAPTTVKPGAQATVQATTTVPGAICTLTVRYRTGGSSIPQFPAETADANGAVSWSWAVAKDVVAGDWPVTVRCQVGLPLDDPTLPFAFATNLLSVH
jgi:hypothetical protein